MDLSPYGFVAGAAPGLISLLRTMLGVRRVMSEARDIARGHGELLDFHSSENQSYDFMFNPQNFIKPGDGPGVRSGKNLLLSHRDKVWRRYWTGFILVILGVPFGLLMATCGEYLLGRPW